MPMGEKTKLLWANPEYRAKMIAKHKSSFAKGRIVWNKNKKLSTEHCKKLSESHIGQVAKNHKLPIRIPC